MGATMPKSAMLMQYERELQSDLNQDKRDSWRIVREHVTARIAEAKAAAEEALNKRKPKEHHEMWTPNPDIKVQLNAPITSAPNKRSADLLKQVIAQFDVNAERYRKRDIDNNGTLDTFCNFYSRDYTRAMGCPLPEGLRANEMFDWLQTERARLLGWEEHDEHTAQRCADEGMCVLAVWKNPEPKKPGHIAPLIPSDGESGTFISNVGASNFARGHLSKGFGNKTPRFWVRP